MDDETDVRLVYAHTEGYGSYDHARLVPHEPFLVGSPRLSGQPSVIRHSRYSVFYEVGCQGLRALLGAAIHYGASVGTVSEHTHERVVPVVAWEYAVSQIGPVEAGHKPCGRAQPQLVLDVIAHLLSGRCGERDERRVFAQLSEYSQVAVVRPELVSPLRDAVGLVHGDQADFKRVQELLETGLNDALRRDVQQLEIALERRPLDSETLLPGLRAVQELGGNSVTLESVHLVLHQRDQGGDYQCDARQRERRKLVTQRLAPAGGHEHDGITTVHHSADDLCLKRAEVVVAEVSLEQSPSPA